MDVSAEAVWACLIRAASWPQWYSNSAQVRFVSRHGPDLALGTVFQWKTFGVSLTSKVREFIPSQRIAWTARGTGVRAYHAWLLVRVPGGCEVRTEETQHGCVARLQQFLCPHRMATQHHLWLEGLRGQARARSAGV